MRLLAFIVAAQLTGATLSETPREPSPKHFVAMEAPCSEASLNTLRSLINAEAMAHEQLWSLVTALLCDAGEPSRRTEVVLRHLAASVHHTTSGLDGPTSSFELRRGPSAAAEMTLATSVNYAELSLPDSRHAALVYAGDICTRRVTIDHQRARWTITRYTSSCD